MSPTRALAVLLAAALTLAFAAAAPAAVSAQADTTLEVVVTTPAGESVADATLTADWGSGSRTRTTAANGKAFISVPEGADVEISVDHPDYVRNAPLEVQDASEREVPMTVYAKSSIQVSVEGPEGAVSGADVSFRKNGEVVTGGSTDDDGTISSGTVEAGTYTVVVTKAGYLVARETVEAEGSVARTVTLERGTVTLEVNVTDDHFDPPRPVEGATVDVSQSGSVRTQPTGLGRISVPVNTWLDISVTKDGYESSSETRFVGESDETIAVTIQRTPALSAELLSDRVVAGENVLVSVTDEYGTPVAGATVLLDGEPVAETDESGRAVVEVASTGEHSVVVEHEELSTAPQTVVGVEEGAAEGTPASGEETETSTDLPGFGPLPALLALLAVVGVGLWRRRHR